MDRVNASNWLRLWALLLIGLVALALVQVTPAQKPTEQDDDVIRVDTDLTNLLFIATDKNGRFNTALTQEDVRLLEDGVLQKFVTFQRETDRPLALAFLIDVSASEERTLANEKAAARSFIETVIQSSKDQAAIVPFTGQAFLEQGLTRDVLSIYRALERVEVALPNYLGSGRPISGIATGPGMAAPPREGTTAIWDAVYVTSGELLASNTMTKDHIPQTSTQRRRAIILLTDGWDTSSRVTRNDALNRALEAETVIYAVGIGDNRHEGVNKGSLDSLATATGGRAFFPKKEQDLKAAFMEIEQELRSQYLVAYSSTNKNRDGAYRKMKLEINNPELQKAQLKLRYRPGYFAKPLR